jgi:hypothetical protein
MHGILIRVKTNVVKVSDVQGKNQEFRFLWSNPNWPCFVAINTKEPNYGINPLFDSKWNLKSWQCGQEI